MFSVFTTKTVLLAYLFYLFIYPLVTVSAGPSSQNYELQNFSFGDNTDTNFSSTNYALIGSLNSFSNIRLTSENFQTLPGLIYQIQSSTPLAPSLSNNNSQYYDKLHLSINYSTVYGSIPNDILFAIAISTDNFSTDTKYVQADQTLGSDPVWQSFTTWGGSNGFNILGLTKDTIYYAKVAARQGQYTQSPFGPTASLPTAENNTLAFDLLTQTLPLGILVPGSITTSSTQAEINLTTNSASGAIVYIRSANSGLSSSSQGNYTIESVVNQQDLSGLAQGYGARNYSTSQVSGLLVANEPYNGNDNVVGQLGSVNTILYTTNNSPINSGVGRFEIRAKSSLSSPPASDYSDTITVTAAGTF